MKWRGPIINGEECPHCTEQSACREAHFFAWEKLPGHRGPPPKCTNESREAFLKAIEKGASPKMACQLVGWSQESYIKWKREVREGNSPAYMAKFFDYDIPQARSRLYEKALDAIGDGLDQEDDDKRAQVGFKILEKLYGSELDLPSTSVRHEGSGGGPVEFRIVMGDTAALPPKIIDAAHEVLGDGVAAAEDASKEE